MPQRVHGLISDAAAPPAGRLRRARAPSGGTCGLISPPTWESAHSLNERGKKKNSSQMPARTAPPQTCTVAPCSGTVTQRPHAAPRAAADPSRAGRTCRRNRAPATALDLHCSASPCRSPLPSSFPRLFHFFLHFSPFFLPPYLLKFIPNHLRRLPPVLVIQAGH